MDEFEAYKQDFDKWVSKWDKALESDIFKKDSIPSTNNQTSINSFFGPIDSNPTKEISDKDSQYWNAIYQTSDGVDMPVQRIDENLEKDCNYIKFDKAFTSHISANPVRRGTEGKDQDLSDLAIDATFNDEDIKKLEEMKIKLHELGSKIAEMKDSEEYQSQLKSLMLKIDSMSDKMNGKSL